MKGNPPCPKCGKPMHRSGTVRRYRDGEPQTIWVCKTGSTRPDGTEGTRIKCYSTRYPERPVHVGHNSKPLGKQPIFKRTRGKTNVFVVTCAQNATPRHKKFYANLEGYCHARNAELLVIPTRYKNPTSRWTQSQQNDEDWDVPEGHLLNTRFKICKNLEVLGDIRTQPTATDPLAGFEAVTAGESGILGHTKLQLRAIATPQGRLPKLLTTTGACTIANYTDSKAGKLGEFHHTLGAAVVEVRGNTFHLRQLNADKKTGEFYDLERLYFADDTDHGEADRPLSITLGDTHVKVVDPVVDRVSQEIVKALRPRNIVWNDLVDGYAFNPHTANNPFVPISIHAQGAASVRQEVLDSFEYMASRTPADACSILVPSNHHDFLQRWINDNDWRRLDASNRVFYLETALALAQEATKLEPEHLNAYIYWAKKRFASAKNVKVLEYDESCMIGEIEHGLHGHLGPNGARGSIKNLRRIGVKTNSGHGHSPGIDEGAFRAGTSTRLRLGYNRGPSSWLNSHILTYANSKRTLISIIHGEWRL